MGESFRESGDEQEQGIDAAQERMEASEVLPSDLKNPVDFIFVDAFDTESELAKAKLAPFLENMSAVLLDAFQQGYRYEASTWQNGQVEIILAIDGETFNVTLSSLAGAFGDQMRCYLAMQEFNPVPEEKWELPVIKAAEKESQEGPEKKDVLGEASTQHQELRDKLSSNDNIHYESFIGTVLDTMGDLAEEIKGGDAYAFHTSLVNRGVPAVNELLLDYETPEGEEFNIYGLKVDAYILLDKLVDDIATYDKKFHTSLIGKDKELNSMYSKYLPLLVDAIFKSYGHENHY